MCVKVSPGKAYVRGHDIEKSGTSDSSAVIETLKEVEIQDSAIGEFSVSKSGDILGAIAFLTELVFLLGIVIVTVIAN